MTGLAAASIILGLATVGICAPGVLWPGRTRAWLGRFPRSRWPAYVLTAVDLLWAGWLLYYTPLGRFEGWKPALYVLTPLSFFLIVRFMEELLAPRALGGLLLLIPAPVFDAARWHPSALRLVVVIGAYALVLAGMVLVLSPFRFRKTVAPIVGSDRSCRVTAAAVLAAGVVLLLLGCVVY